MPGKIKNQMPARGILVWGTACVLFSALSFAMSGEQELATARAATDNDRTVLPVPEKINSTIRVNSNLVLVPVTVTDHSGKAVSGLEMAHFTLFDGNAPQKITHFSAEDAPSSIGIVFDSSDSMGPKMRKAREAVNALLNSVNPNSEFFFERFSNRAEIMVPMTSHVREIHDYVERLEVGGGTALLDGVRLAMNEMTHARYLRKAIVIISDGEDNSSHWTVPELKEAVREKDILIYAIAIPDGSNSYGGWQTQKGPVLLQEIASKTGGTMFPVSNIRQIPDVANKIGSWLRTQYVLGFVPDAAAADGTYRQIHLKIDRPKGFPRLHAVWRQGYFAPKE